MLSATSRCHRLSYSCRCLHEYGSIVIVLLVLLISFISDNGVSGTKYEEVACRSPDDRRTCFEDSVKSKLVFKEFDPIVVRCVIRNLGRQAVTWMKNDGNLIPLTIGDTAFTPDPRVSVDYSNTDEWNLVIKMAQKQDAGEYFCQVNTAAGVIEKSFRVLIQEPFSDSKVKDQVIKKSRLEKPTLGPGKDNKVNLMNDSPAIHPVRAGDSNSGNVRIYGQQTVFAGEEFVSFTCTAQFRTRSAKMNPQAKVEWYHQGIKQISDPEIMDISMSWKDGNTARSVLMLYKVTFHQAGEWVCLKKPTENGFLETATHSLTVLEKDVSRESQVLARSSLAFGKVASRSHRSSSFTQGLLLILTTLTTLHYTHSHLHSYM